MITGSSLVAYTYISLLDNEYSDEIVLEDIETSLIAFEIK